MSPDTDIEHLIQQANPNRSIEDFPRRFMKLSEEVGEAAEAYLSVTSLRNRKGKTWDDVREELADSVIVGLDLCLTRMPDQLHLTDEEVLMNNRLMIISKLEKWLADMAVGNAATQAG